jgi:glycine/D-amino acid oxidase-like deaminating enzyme
MRYRDTARPARGSVPDASGPIDRMPTVVIGAGPVGLVAAAHLLDRGLEPIVLDAGDQAGAAVREWAHVRMFTPWQYIVDPVAGARLRRAGWVEPQPDALPTGRELVDRYVVPLAATLGDRLRLRTRVVAVTRAGGDKTRTSDRAERPFLVRAVTADGSELDIAAAAVIDASGTWGTPNPVGASGIPAVGERAAAAAGLVTRPLPDVLGADRATFAGRVAMVVGSGHSAATTLIALAELATEAPATTPVWVLRQPFAGRLSATAGETVLPARGQLASDLRALVAAGRVRLLRNFSISRLTARPTGGLTVTGATPDGERSIDGIDVVVPATGFRPDLSIVSELLLDLDPAVEAPRRLAPLIDPAVNICSTVPPHGHRELTHLEPGFYIVGMKSYGRASTFLVTTANEQVRSVVAAIAGDMAAADEVRLVLPEIGAACACCVPVDDAAGHAHEAAAGVPA